MTEVPPPTSHLPQSSPGHLPCSSLIPLLRSSRRPSVSFGGFGLRSYQGTSYVTEFAQGLIRAAAVLGSHRVAVLIDQWSMDEPVRFKTWLLLGGGVWPDGQLDLGHGLRVYALPNRSDQFPRSVPELSSLSPYDLLGQPVLELDTMSSPALFRPGDGDDYQDVQTHTSLGDISLEVFMLALSLVCNRQVGIARAWSDYGEVSAFYAGRSARVMGLMRPGPVRPQLLGGNRSHQLRTNIYELSDYQRGAPNLTCTQLFEALEIAEPLSSLLGSDQRFEIAVTRWSLAALPGVVSPNRVVDLRIALEAFYLDTDHEELSFRLALTCARFLGNSLEERRSIRDAVRGFYNVASQVIHGKAIAAIKKVDSGEIDYACRLCRDGILRRLAEPSDLPWSDFLLS